MRDQTRSLPSNWSGGSGVGFPAPSPTVCHQFHSFPFRLPGWVVVVAGMYAAIHTRVCDIPRLMWVVKVTPIWPGSLVTRRILVSSFCRNISVAPPTSWRCSGPERVPAVVAGAWASMTWMRMSSCGGKRLRYPCVAQAACRAGVRVSSSTTPSALRFVKAFWIHLCVIGEAQVPLML